MRGLILLLLCALFLPLGASAFTITFDYSYDTNDFFDGASADALAANASLQAAGAFYESIILDDLAAISPDVPYSPPAPGNRWQANFVNPSTGVDTSENFLFVPADTIIVFVGAYDLGGSTLGEAGFGGYFSSGTLGWLETLEKRGEIGETVGVGTADEFAPWGGNLSVDIDSTWNYDHTVAPTGLENDLYSVLLHEIGHILGLGTSDAWRTLIDQGPNPDRFTGTASVAEFGGPIDLDGNGPPGYPTHWEDGTMSTEYGGGPAQEAAMDPSLTSGTRKIVTDLDAAGFDDIGWDIAPVPEPSSALLFAGAVGLLFFRRSRRGLLF